MCVVKIVIIFVYGILFEMKLTLSALGMVNAMGDNLSDILAHLLSGQNTGIQTQKGWRFEKTVPVGAVRSELPLISDSLPHYNMRCNQLLLAALNQIRSEVDVAIQTYGRSRVGVVMGSSTTGILEGEAAAKQFYQTGQYPESYYYDYQEIGTPSAFLSDYLELESPSFTVSTACTSSSKALGSAQRLIQLGLYDAVLVGGADTLCRMTVNGFDCLESVSNDVCNPFSQNRNGITIGEGAALFLLEKATEDTSTPLVLGIGESSDAHHITAPDPEGVGATLAITLALNQANLKPENINYINLHGTATIANDKMESKAVYDVFGDHVPCSSTKPFTGHTLGAAGLTELGICWLVLSELNVDKKLPLQLWDAQLGNDIQPIQLVSEENATAPKLETCMSMSFAFGGNNTCVIISR